MIYILVRKGGVTETGKSHVKSEANITVTLPQTKATP